MLSPVLPPSPNPTPSVAALISIPGPPCKVLPTSVSSDCQGPGLKCPSLILPPASGEVGFKVTDGGLPESETHASWSALHQASCRDHTYFVNKVHRLQKMIVSRSLELLTRKDERKFAVRTDRSLSKAIAYKLNTQDESITTHLQQLIRNVSHKRPHSQ